MFDRTDIVYLYDGSFDGFLSAVFEAFLTKDAVKDIIKGNDIQLGFNTVIKKIETDMKKAKRVAAGLEKKLGKDAEVKIYSAFLSEIEGWEKDALNWIRLGFSVGRTIFSRLNDQCVVKINDMERKVFHERHLLTGFLRFSQLKENGDAYYAEITPKHNILEILMPHFCDRFNTMPFIIYDKRRGIAGVYDAFSWVVMPIEQELNPEFSTDEYKYQEMFKAFCKAVTIKERISYKRRIGLMPKRFWENMVEVKDQL